MTVSTAPTTPSATTGRGFVATGGALGAAAVDDLPQDRLHLDAAAQQHGTAAERVHDAQPSQRGLVVEEAQQFGKPRPDRVAPARLGGVCGRDSLRGSLYAEVERRQQARVAIVEALVEDAAADPGASDRVAQRQRRDTPLGHERGRSLEDLRSLRLLHVAPSCGHARTVRTSPTSPSHCL